MKQSRDQTDVVAASCGSRACHKARQSCWISSFQLLHLILSTTFTGTTAYQTADMRFQDWDVLLFPYGSHVPIREFRTGCFAQQDGLAATPLMTCFVPSLHDGAPFQISLHSWNKPTSILGPNAGYATGTHYVWRIKIAVDGHVAVADMLPEDVTWPRQIGVSHSGMHSSLTIVTDNLQTLHPLLVRRRVWPSRSSIARSCRRVTGTPVMRRGASRSSCPRATWLRGMASRSSSSCLITLPSLSSPLPSVSVPSVWYVGKVRTKVLTRTDILERSGIAWPNASLPIVNNPLQPPDARQMSVGGLPFPDDGSSRSTSAYSTYSPAAYPPMQVPALSPHPASYAHSLGQEGLKLRLPTDQLQTIINALSPSRPFTNVCCQ